MTLEAYHKAINQGFSESEACKIADEAFEQYQIDQAQYAAEAEAQYAAEMEAQAKAEFDAALAAEGGE